MEYDEKGQKKASPDILLRLSLTRAELLSLPAVRVDEKQFDLNRSLMVFRDWMERIGEPQTEDNIRDMTTMRFRGDQPRTKED